MVSLCPSEAQTSKDRRTLPSHLPALGHWADIAFIAWQERCRENQKPVTGLKHVFRCQISNQETLKVVRALCGQAQLTDCWVQNRTYDPDSDEGKALIGTPNGASVAWLLLKHRQNLGRKRITRVTLMANPEMLNGTELLSDSPHLCFDLEDVGQRHHGLVSVWQCVHIAGLKHSHC